MIPLIPDNENVAEAAGRLAARWGFEPASEPDIEFALVLTETRLELRRFGPDAPGPVWVDFVGGAVAHRRRFGGGRGQPIAKAVGLKGGRSPRVLDATAGLGRDAFVLASLGCYVTLVERSPVAAALLEDGLARASTDPETASVVARMQLRRGDARQLLALATETPPDVVYLDPMYPKLERRAKVKKEMQAFQALIGGDPDADALLEPALAAAKERVVVKRPDGAPPLAGRTPTLTYGTRKHRFDVYVLRAIRAG